MKRVTFVLVLLIAGLVHAQPLADRVPGDAWVYFGWSGSDALGPAYQNSRFKKFMDSSAFPQLIHETLPAILQQVADQKPQDAQQIAQMQELGRLLARRPTAIYLRGLSVADRPEKQKVPAVQVGIICQAGADKDTVTRAFQQLAQSADKKLAASVEQADDAVTLRIGQAQAPAGKLTESPAFKSASGHFTADAAIVVFVDTQTAIARLDENLKADASAKEYEQFSRGLDATGLKGLKRIVMSAGFAGGDWQSQLFIEAPAPRKGLLKLLEPTPIDPALTARIPADAVSAAVLQFDFAELLARIRETATAADPKSARQFNQAVGALGMSVGRRIDTELLAPLGSQWALYASPTLGGTGPMGLIAANKLDDPKLAKAAWADLYHALANVLPNQLKRQGVTITPTADDEAVAGATLYSFAIDRAPGVTPCFVVSGDFIYFGVDPAVLAKAANQPAAQADAAPAYQQLAREMGVTAFSSFRYTDLPKTAPAIVGQVNAFWPMLGGPAADQGIQLPKQLLPPADQIGDLLTPAGTFSWADEKGFHSRSRLPFPGAGMLGYAQGDETTLAVAGSAMVGAGLPVMFRAREQANRLKSMSNQRQLAMAIMMYANENRNKPPPDLGSLVKYIGQPQVFVAPAGETSVPPEIEKGTPEQIAAWVNAHSDYVYVRPEKLDGRDGHQRVVLYEKIGLNGGEGVHMGFADGHCEFVPMSRATELLKQAGVPEPVKYEPAP